MTDPAKPWLLSVVEMGGYPNFAALYPEFGYQVEIVPSMRKAQAWLKNHKPAVVVTEFHFDPGFRDRMSNLESLLATLQRYDAPAKVIVFVDLAHLPRLERVQERYPIFAALPIPVNPEALCQALERARGLTDLEATLK